MWVAKISEHLGDLFEFELSPRFKSIYDCQKYIDENLKDIEHFLSRAFSLIQLARHLKGKPSPYLSLNLGSFIRCYNVHQSRFCTGFDF